jgi:hypothetical protein
LWERSASASATKSFFVIVDFHAVQAVLMRFFGKPYSPAQVRQTLERLLEASAAEAR